jgi:pyruvate formate lyase activating enzyme
MAPDDISHPGTTDPGQRPGRWFHALADGRLQCDLCPRHCRLREGQRAFCFVRQRLGDRIILTTYGRSTGLCIDPIEKKPLHHFFPGSAVLSFGTAGCNLGCRFCQNWDLSKAHQTEVRSMPAPPEMIAAEARDAGCTSVAFTYNDPIVWAEYALDVAAACREHGLRTVAVTSGYIDATPREEFFAAMDAANVDLKAFTERFYRKLCLGRLQPVLDTLLHLRETDVWFEVTNLLIPGHNDSPGEVESLCHWLLDHLGEEIPLHFSAFHPDYRMGDVPPTPPALLGRARQQALAVGLKHVYTGNVHDTEGGSTYCTGCGRRLIGRDWYRLDRWNLDEHGACRACGRRLAGRFGTGPGDWGPHRRPVRTRAAEQD